MTIPIEPGPFSFLAGAGRTLGRIGELREERRKTALDEARESARNMIALRAAGLMNPKDFERPEVQAIFEMAGFGQPSAEPTSAETIERGKRDYFSQIAPSLGGGAPTDEARAIYGLPQRGLTEKIDADIAGSRAAVPEAQLRGTVAEAQLPDAAPTALAGQQGTQDKTFNEIADRVVETLYGRTKKLPTTAEALALGQSDERAKVFGSRITEQYYGSAIERLRARLEDEKTKRLNATSRAQGAAGTGLDDYLRIHQGQQTRITAELNALEKPSDTDVRIADMAAQMRSKGKPVTPMFAAAEQRVAEYRRRRGELEQQLQQSREQLDRLLQGQTGAPGVAPPGTSGSPQRRAAAEEYERRVQGVTDPAKRKKIADEVARKYNIGPQVGRGLP